MKYSIAIPAYKRTFLFQCIESILKQDYSDFELIIVNDASPEDLDSVVEQFADPRIKYFKNKINNGAEHVVDNWNVCLSHATGEYFVLMGDDDEMLPYYLSTFNKLIDRFSDLNVFHCRSYIINDKSEKQAITSSWPEWESVYANIWHRMSGLRTQFISDFVYKRKYLLDAGGFYKLPLAWASDDISSFEAAITHGIAHTEKPIFCYRQSNITLSNSGSIVLKMKAIKEEEIWYDSFLESNVPITDIDVILYQCIKAKRSNYFAKKRVETLAYNGINKKNVLSDFIKHYNKRKLYNVNFQQLIYAFVLFLKKNKTEQNNNG